MAGSYCKYKKEIYEVSYDGGVSWRPHLEDGHEVYRTGELLQCNAPECGFIEPQSRWENMNINSDFICDNFNKYYKQLKYWSYDGGAHWEPSDPPEYQKGDLYEANSYDCDYGVTWVRTEEGFICEEKPPVITKWEEEGFICGTEEDGDLYTKYVKEVQYESEDNGLTWTKTDVERKGQLIEENSIYCGYIDNTVVRKWQLLPDSFICMGSDETYGKGIPSYSGSLIFTVVIPSSMEISVPFDGQDMQISWGDGTEENGNNTHTYQAGTYSIKIYGKATIGVYGGIERTNFLNTLIGIESWGDSLEIAAYGISNGIFSNCPNLLYVADDTFGALNNINDFTNWFNNCPNYSMRSIYVKRNNNFMPLYNTELIGTGCFNGCENLYDYKIIPTNWK